MPAPSPEKTATLFLSLAARLNRNIDETLKRSQLSVSRYRILWTIAGRPEGSIPTVLCSLLGITAKTLSFHLRHLEDSGLIKRKIDSDDRRSYRFLVSAKGKDKLERAAPLLERSIQKNWSPLLESEVAALFEIVQRIK